MTQSLPPPPRAKPKGKGKCTVPDYRCDGGDDEELVNDGVPDHVKDALTNFAGAAAPSAASRPTPRIIPSRDTMYVGDFVRNPSNTANAEPSITNPDPDQVTDCFEHWPEREVTWPA